MDSWKEKAIKFAATGCGSGLAPLAPGTVGTLVGIPVYVFFALFPWPAYLLALLSFTTTAAYVAQRAEALYALKDPPRVVIDEMAGFLWTMFCVPPAWSTVLAGFMLFRFFDIVKPFPVRALQDKLPGGYGVVGDDVMAGIYSNLVLQILMRFSIL